jgi:MYXO-CTERM domain-containing protein
MLVATLLYVRAAEESPMFLRFTAVAAAVTSFCIPSSGQAFTEDCRYGVNAHQASNATLDEAAAAGIGWVRFDFNWFQIEPTESAYDWSIPDRFFAHAATQGLNVFATVAYTPSWAAPQPCNDADPEPLNWCRNRPPVNGADWTDFVTAAVGRYGAQVKTWGMWNEPNLVQFYTGTRAQYTYDILIPGSDAVHAACADCNVAGPDLAHLRGGADWDADEGLCVFGECLFNGWNYSLSEILQDAGAWIDIVTHHKYADPSLEWWLEALDGEWLLGVQYVNGIKEVTDLHAPGKPVWITELGWEMEPYGSYSNAYAQGELDLMMTGLDQAIAGTYPGATNQPWPELEKLFWYDLKDDPSGYSWGLLDEFGVAKPAWTTYANAITTLGDCIEPVVGDDDDVTDDDDDIDDDDAIDDDDSEPETDDDDSEPPADDDDSEPETDDDEPEDEDEVEADPFASSNGAIGCTCDASNSSGGGLLALMLLGLGRRWRRRRPASR